ncbi:MAG: hypothetical protein K0Q70_188 [Rhodospirillales bacterium]|nr:hypothetical protein [Rhodospirillales bacterium]
MAIYELDGKSPELPEDGSYFIADNATVIGNVQLGANVSIWFNTVVRGDNDCIEIGAGTNIQDNSMLHTDPGKVLSIGKNVTVGHKVILHGCTIEDDVLIGMGAIIMNDAHIRRGSIVGAGAVVTEGKEFPERSMILGAPGRAVREVTDDHLRGIGRVGASYVRNGQRFQAGLRKLG